MALLVVVVTLLIAPGATDAQPNVPGYIIGDCNGDGTVSINELILSVNVALTYCPPTICADGPTACEALFCDYPVPFLPPPPLIVCLMAAVNNTLMQGCLADGYGHVTRGRVFCD